MKVQGKCQGAQPLEENRKYLVSKVLHISLELAMIVLYL